MMRKSTYLLSLLLAVRVAAHAGPLADKAGVTETVREQATQQAEGWFKRVVVRGAQAGLNYLAPGSGDAVGKMIGLGSVEDKVERIEKKQDTTIGQIRGIAFQALATKKKLEQLYYYKKQAERNAQEMLRSIKDSDPRKFIGGFGEDMLGIPLKLSTSGNNTTFFSFSTAQRSGLN